VEQEVQEVETVLFQVLMEVLQLLYQLHQQVEVLVLVGLDHQLEKAILEVQAVEVLEVHLLLLLVMLEDLIHQKVILDQLLHQIMVQEVEVVELLKLV
jgi:hypothetical protein|tara:strand:- start:215 stop:508 length:294 start_codon:yes stop_codon:yes gene_type:complete